MVKFHSVQELIEAANRENKTISQIALAQTAADMEKPEDTIYNQMREHLIVMKEAAIKGVGDIKSISGLTGGMAKKAKEYAESGTISGSFMGEVIYTALAVSEVNACMGRIVAAPTAGSCGIVPACLITVSNHRQLSEETIIMGLFNASAIGAVIAKNATLAGAQGGCMAECGSASAMAASALVEIMGGTSEMCGHAAAQALKSHMGLVCDPVAGLVEGPCIIRNASGAVVAVACAEMALAGIESIIPIDEVIAAMDSVGKLIPPSLRETSEGGIAVSKTGKKITVQLIERLQSNASTADG